MAPLPARGAEHVGPASRLLSCAFRVWILAREVGVQQAEGLAVGRCAWFALPWLAHLGLGGRVSGAAAAEICYHTGGEYDNNKYGEDYDEGCGGWVGGDGRGVGAEVFACEEGGRHAGRSGSTVVLRETLDIKIGGYGVRIEQTVQRLEIVASEYEAVM